jgi:hypothetical protein
MVLVKVLLCKFPEFLVEGSGEHHVAVISILVHIFFESAKLKRKVGGSRRGLRLRNSAQWQTFSLTSS